MAGVGKKAMFFTLISILIVTTMLLAFNRGPALSEKYRMPAIKTRIMVANELTKDLKEHYIERVLYVSSYRGLVAATMYVNSTQNYFVDYDDFLEAYRQIVVNGSAGADQLKRVLPIMTDNTLNYRLNQLAIALNQSQRVAVNFRVLNLSINQSEGTGPWDVNVTLDINYTVDAGVASWGKVERISTLISIVGLDDPMYLVETEGVYPNTINNTLDGMRTEVVPWNITYLNDSINKRAYRKESEAPSYLMRFYRDLSGSDCCGIESIIPREWGMEYTLKSFADYCYWGTACDGRDLYSIHNITGVPSGYAFRLDSGHVLAYNVQDYIYEGVEEEEGED